MRFPNKSWGARALWASILGFSLLSGAALLGGTGRGPGDGAGRRADRPPRFTVELQLPEAGISGYFIECTGLGSENEIVEFRDGNDPNVVRKLPGRLKYDNIVLKRGMTGDGSLWQWRRLVEMGNVEDARFDGKIVLLDRGSPVAIWNFTKGWPVKISGPQLQADGNDIAIEEIVIAHEGIKLE